MNTQFDELTKSIAQSVTRRAALKKFGFGLAGMALACFGLADKAQAAAGNCWQTGVLCFSGLTAQNPSRECRRCCNGYVCVRAGDWGIGKNCYCQ